MTVLYMGDCLEALDSVPDKGVDMILCDLPYGVLNKNNEDAKWDVPLPLDQLWDQYNRVIKDNGAIVLFGTGLFTAELMMSNARIWRYNLVWDKGRTTGFLNSKRMPLRCHEDLCVFYKKLPTYNPQMTKCKPEERNHSRGHQLKEPTNRCYGAISKCPDAISDYKYPRSIIRIPKGFCKDEWQHPTQKPVALCEWLIRTYTNEGDLVLDNCMGVGSTGVAAMNTNRRFIGMEWNRKYFEIAVDRITKASNKSKQISEE